MLVITARRGERIHIGDNVVLRIVDIDESEVQVAIENADGDPIELTEEDQVLVASAMTEANWSYDWQGIDE